MINIPVFSSFLVSRWIFFGLRCEVPVGSGAVSHLDRCSKVSGNSMWMKLGSVTFRLKVCMCFWMHHACAQLLHRTLLTLIKPSFIQSHVRSPWMIWLMKWVFVNTKAHISNITATMFQYLLYVSESRNVCLLLSCVANSIVKMCVFLLNIQLCMSKSLTDLSPPSSLTAPPCRTLWEYISACWRWVLFCLIK